MDKTAIILFANLPDFEARAKSFSGFSSKKATQKISSVLTQHFYSLAKQTSADSFLIDSYHQKGKSFGERITNAFADIYAKGYENIICIAFHEHFSSTKQFFNRKYTYFNVLINIHLLLLKLLIQFLQKF